jgi:chloramphenicol 3-O phosphotransferase
VAWVGVHCDPEVAGRREASRADREPGMAIRQATAVHRDVGYDVEVDTTHTGAQDCARTVVTRLELG